MKKEIADKWVAALRSGKYKQGRRRLRSRDDAFCCLGVLCDILNIPSQYEYDSHYYSGAHSYLPLIAISMAGMGSASGGYPTTITNQGYTLAGMNDAGMSFTEIADIIEANWENL